MLNFNFKRQEAASSERISDKLVKCLAEEFNLDPEFAEECKTGQDWLFLL